MFSGCLGAPPAGASKVRIIPLPPYQPVEKPSVSLFKMVQMQGAREMPRAEA